MIRHFLNFIFALTLLISVAPANTITLPAGNFTYAQVGLISGGDVTIIGGGAGKTIINLTPDANGIGLHFTGDNITVKGVTFRGGGILFDKASGRNTNVSFDDFEIFTSATGQSANAITFTSGLSRASFTHGHLEATNGFCVYGYNYDSLVLQWLELVKSGAGMHIAAFGDCSNLLVQGIFLEQIKGMGLEFQGQADSCRFADCWYQKPNLSAVRSANDTSFAYSLPLDRGTNILIEHLVAIAPEAPDGLGVRIGVECGGQTTIRNCYLQVANVGIGCTDGDGNCRVTATDCTVIARVPTQRDNGPVGDLVLSNVGPSAKPDIDLLARGQPTKSGTFTGRIYTTESLPKTLSATATIQPALGTDGGGVASVTFANPPSGITQIKYSGVAAGNPSDSRGVVAEKIIPYASTIIVPSLPPGYRTRLNFTLLNAAGVSVNSCTCDTAEAPGSSTSPWPIVTPTQPTDDPATVAELKSQVSELKARIAAGMKALQP